MLMHHLFEVDDMSLHAVEYVVIDEADCLFSMGFAEQLHKILAQLSDNRQTLLFSAALPSAIAEFAKDHRTSSARARHQLHQRRSVLPENSSTVRHFW